MQNTQMQEKRASEAMLGELAMSNTEYAIYSKGKGSINYAQYIPYGYRTLDRIAVLLTGRDACSAVSLYGDKDPEQQIVIAYNSDVNDSTDRKILIQTLNNIAKFRTQQDNINDDNIKEIASDINTLKELALSQSKAAIERQEQDNNNQLTLVAKKKIVDRYNSYAQKVINSICYGKDAVTLDIVKALSGGVLIAQGQSADHAEMKILSNIKKVNNKNAHYIGVSKLCCRQCTETISQYNSNKKNSCKVVVRGSHFHDRGERKQDENSAPSSVQNQGAQNRTINKETYEDSDGQLDAPNQVVRITNKYYEQRLQLVQYQLQRLSAEKMTPKQRKQLGNQILKPFSQQSLQQLQQKQSTCLSNVREDVNTLHQTISQLQPQLESALQDNTLKNIPNARYLLYDKLLNPLSKLPQQLKQYLQVQELQQFQDMLQTINKIRGITNDEYLPSLKSIDAINVIALPLLKPFITKMNDLNVKLQNLLQTDNVLKVQQLEQQMQKEAQQQQNLRRWEKRETGMLDELVKANVWQGAVLEEMRRKVSEGVKVEVRHGEKKVGHVELLGEMHDEHGASAKALVEKMERGEMGAGTVVALERKEGGEHLGMQDVRLLAEVMRYNEGCKEEERIALPAGIEGSAIWWDAKMVNVARERGVQVIGVEGKDLAHDQHSPEYDKDREDYMAQQLVQLKQHGYNVVMPVGEAHVQGLQARLSANATMKAIRNKTAPQNHAQSGTNKAQTLSQHPVTPNTKQVYGKFTAQIAKNSMPSRSVT